MRADARRIIVAATPCSACGTERIVVYHQSLPELRIVGPSAKKAARRLAVRLTADLDVVTDPAHREPVWLALADLRAFVDREDAVHPNR